MKKSVIVLIGVVFVLAVVIVNFFGLQIKIFNETIYVEKIELKEGSYEVDGGGSKYIVIDYDPTPNAMNVAQIEWRVFPDEATRKSVEFLYDTENQTATVDKFGKVIFNREGAITIIISATDGSGKSEKVTVMAIE